MFTTVHRKICTFFLNCSSLCWQNDDKTHKSMLFTVKQLINMGGNETFNNRFRILLDTPHPFFILFSEGKGQKIAYIHCITTSPWYAYDEYRITTYSSHMLEETLNWGKLQSEGKTCLKGGKIIQLECDMCRHICGILMDLILWRYSLQHATKKKFLVS